MESLWFEEANTYTYLMTIPQTNCYGSPPSCTTTYMYIPMTHRDDADWMIRIKGVVDRETVTRDIEVTEELYKQLHVGDHYVVEE